MFIKCAKEIGYDDSDDPENEDLLDNGYYESQTENRSVYISWSDI
jgi:hypothetical protein